MLGSAIKNLVTVVAKNAVYLLHEELNFNNASCTILIL